MRRLLSLVLLLVFGLPVVSPAFGLGPDADANLPACCRRNGAHHCRMSVAEREALTHGTQVATLRPRCPAYPAALSPAAHISLAAPNRPFTLTPAVDAAATVRAVDAAAGVALHHTQPKRGPPAASL